MLTATVVCHAVPLDNWRFPYYREAAGLGFAGSTKSGMFWDDITGHPGFGADLWPDTSRLRGNYLTIEPALALHAQSVQTFFIDTTPPVSHYINDKKQAQYMQEKGSYWGGQALCDARYRNILIREVLDVDSRDKYDLDYRGKTDRFAAGRIAEAYCRVDWKHVFFRIGRLNRNWGPFPDRSLLLSANPHSYDALEFDLSSSFFEFRYLFAAFPYENSFVDVDGASTNRYLSAHSLNLLLGKFGEIGFLETMLFTRNGGLPDLQLVNPFSLYSVINTNGEGAGNLMLGAQWNIHPFIQNLSLMGQVLLDDFQVDNSTSMDQEPTHWGADLGVYYSDFLPMKKRHYLSLEYRYLSRWLYTVMPLDEKNGQRYTYLGRGIGAETNDNDRVNLSFFMAGNNYWAGSLGMSLNRQGENSLWSKWRNFSKDSTLAPNTLGYRTEPKFPSGIVERTLDCYVSLMGYYKNFADVSFMLHNRWIRNKNNVSTNSYEYDPLFSLSISFHYSNFVLPLPK